MLRSVELFLAGQIYLGVGNYYFSMKGRGELMRNLVLCMVLCVSGSAVFADTLDSGSSAAVGSAFNPIGAYWNNVSSGTVNGSNQINVGDFVNNKGGFASPVLNCSTCDPATADIAGGQMYTTGITGSTNDATSGLNFVRQAGALSISLLYAFSGNNGNVEIGLYDQANPYMNHLILAQADTAFTGNLNNRIGQVYTSGLLFEGTSNLGTYDLSNGSPFATWGIYVRTCSEGSTVTFAQCRADHDVNTYYMGASSQLDSANGFQTYDPSHEHFALFQSGSNLNQYYAGIEDYAYNTAFQTANPIEASGDYKDIILGINTSAPIPEPATLSIVGLSLAGLGFLRRRSLKKS